MCNLFMCIFGTTHQINHLTCLKHSINYIFHLHGSHGDHLMLSRHSVVILESIPAASAAGEELCYTPPAKARPQAGIKDHSFSINLGFFVPGPRTNRLQVNLSSLCRIFGFYKGILPPIVAETPKRAVKVRCGVEQVALSWCTLNTSQPPPPLRTLGCGRGSHIKTPQLACHQSHTSLFCHRTVTPMSNVSV